MAATVVDGGQIGSGGGFRGNGCDDDGVGDGRDGQWPEAECYGGRRTATKKTATTVARSLPTALPRLLTPGGAAGHPRSAGSPEQPWDDGLAATAGSNVGLAAAWDRALDQPKAEGLARRRVGVLSRGEA